MTMVFLLNFFKFRARVARCKSSKREA